MSSSLTKMQRFILRKMLEHGATAFVGGEGSRGGPSWFEAKYGPVIRAYQTPEWFLRGRGLIARVDSNAPGNWYRLTTEGERRAKRLRIEPKRVRP